MQNIEVSLYLKNTFMSGHFKNMSGQTHVTPYILSGHPNEVIIVPEYCTQVVVLSLMLS